MKPKAGTRHRHFIASIRQHGEHLHVVRAYKQPSPLLLSLSKTDLKVDILRSVSLILDKLHLA